MLLKSIARTHLNEKRLLLAVSPQSNTSSSSSFHVRECSMKSFLQKTFVKLYFFPVFSRLVSTPGNYGL